jgi:hypothetical protein
MLRRGAHIADCTLQGAGLEYGGGARAGGQHVGDGHRSLRRVCVSDSNVRACRHQSLAPRVGGGHQFRHGIDQEGAGSAKHRPRAADCRLNGFAIAKHGSGAEAAFPAGELRERCNGAGRNAERHPADAPREHR